MRRGSGWESELTPEQMNPNNWPAVDTSGLSATDEKLFKRRRRAVRQYLGSGLTVEEILDNVGMSRSELYRLATRALTLAADGEPWGYSALLPCARLVSYTRTDESTSGKAGRFSQFLDKHPTIKQALIDWALGKKKINGKKVRGRHFKRIWKAFKRLCITEGIDTNAEYPFTNDDGGREAVRRFCRAVRRQDFVRGAATEFGEEAGRLAGSAKKRSKHNKIPLRPYQQVQLDAHPIDGLFVVEMQGPDGEWYELPLERIWLLALVDCASRAELGYSISLERNYTIEDVLTCITHALVPWQPLTMPSERICYRPGSGFPSGVIPACAWRAFDAVRWDNAYAQRSPWVKQHLLNHIANEVISNKGRNPRSNAIVERFFRSFEDLTFHNWPNTTGSSPDDPRRDHPEENAERFHIDYDDLILAADLGGATYNAQPHSELNDRSPLDYLRYRIERKLDLIRKVSFRTENNPLFYRDFKVTIRGSEKQGHLPYVQLQYGTYSNDALIGSPDLIGTKAVLRVNIEDGRSGELFGSNGKSYGHLLIDGRWASRRHPLRIRGTIKSLMRKHRIPADSMNPLDDFEVYLGERARTSKRARNQLLKFQLETTGNTHLQSTANQGLKAHHQPSTRGWVSIVHAYSR